MSDEPERIFSMAGNLLSLRRRTMKGKGIKQILCLKSWQQTGIIRLDQQSFSRAIATAGDCVLTEDLDTTELIASNLLYHELS